MTRETKASEIARTTIGDTLRANPIPLALVGLGLAWLLAQNSRVVDDVLTDERVRAARRRIGETIGLKAGDGVAATKAEAEGWVHRSADAARGALHMVRGSAAVERAGQFAGEAGERASQ